MAERHRVLAREQREFDAQERRYEDRRKAVSDFLVLPAPYSYILEAAMIGGATMVSNGKGTGRRNGRAGKAVPKPKVPKPKKK